MLTDTTTGVVPGTYRHFKGGVYEVIGVAKNSETEEEVVVYRAMYGERTLFVRPREMFSEAVGANGLRRFEIVHPTS